MPKRLRSSRYGSSTLIADGQKAELGKSNLKRGGRDRDDEHAVRVVFRTLDDLLLNFHQLQHFLGHFLRLIDRQWSGHVICPCSDGSDAMHRARAGGVVNLWLWMRKHARGP